MTVPDLGDDVEWNRIDTVLASFERRREDGRQRLERLRGEREELEARAIELKQSADESQARLSLTSPLPRKN